MLKHAAMAALPKSLPRIAVALGFPAASQLIRAAECEYKDGNTLLEFRLDHLADAASGIHVIRSFLRKYPDAHILATCRRQPNHGGFSGSIEQQVAILADAGKIGSSALDLEIESAEQAKPALASLRESAALIVSYHNFESTPALAGILRRLQRVPADAYKAVFTARKPSDNLRLIEFAREHQDPPLIAFTMSEIGLATRVLAPSLGCPFTYAAPRNNAGTAPGQIAANVMHSLYRCEKLGRQTRIYGVIADPVAHSKSPLIHNRAFQARRIDAVYLPFLVPPAHLSDWMKLASALPVAGFSVTIPHKQRILSHLHIVEPFAKRVGAVNTVWRKGGKWRGTNTDAEGVLKPLSRRLRLAHANILIAGYGGAARSAAIALCDAGANITITGRKMERAQALARAAKAEIVSLQEAQSRHFDALVHATPVGMSPKTGECLFNDQIPADVVLDMVYNPQETLLLKRAKEQGCTIIPGSEMLIEQAARQFEIWTGESAPRTLMQSALDQYD
jgi:3-dehydroquinate dehydratase/shikimate dehydrogenase